MRGAVYGLLSCLILMSIACSRDESTESSIADSANLRVWVHSGQPGEQRVIQDQVARFNAAQNEVKVELTVIPEGGYNAQIQAAALAGDFPDLLEFDGPFVYRYIWQGYLRALDDLLPDTVRTDLLASIVQQGTYQGRLFSVGTFDSGLGLWADRKRLEAVGARIPALAEKAWTVDEFDRLLRQLAVDDPDGAVIDLKLNYTGEWYTYAFSPVLQSAGADLISRNRTPISSGVLDSPQAVAALRYLQTWIQSGLVDPNLDDAAFTHRRVALSWVGHWEYPRYREALGEDLVLLPLPDFGRGSRTGQGSWNWGITTNCRNPEAAAQFLTFLLQPQEVLAMTGANGAVPATQSAIAASALFHPGGRLHLFVQQLRESAVPRPRTPAYPFITSAFQQAFADIRNGRPVSEALHNAAMLIDQDIEDNRGYPPVAK